MDPHRNGENLECTAAATSEKVLQRRRSRKDIIGNPVGAKRTMEGGGAPPKRPPR
jgi:hypothetical protein